MERERKALESLQFGLDWNPELILFEFISGKVWVLDLHFCWWKKGAFQILRADRMNVYVVVWIKGFTRALCNLKLIYLSGFFFNLRKMECEIGILFRRGEKAVQ